MLIRISLIVAIIAGLAVGALNFTKIRTNITDLRTHLQQQTDRAETAERHLAKTTADLKTATNELAQTRSDLAVAKKDLAAAVIAENDLKKQASTLQANLTKAQSDLTDANILLAQYQAAFKTPQEALSVSKDMKALQDKTAVIEDEKKVLQRQLVRVQNELDIYRDPNRPIPLPASLIGKVLVADPKWDFVIINFGEDQGALKNGQLLVNRDGRLVAKIQITSVQKDRCVANVLPGWKLGEVLEGDQVIPAYPSQS